MNEEGFKFHNYFLFLTIMKHTGVPTLHSSELINKFKITIIQCLIGHGVLVLLQAIYSSLFRYRRSGYDGSCKSLNINSYPSP